MNEYDPCYHCGETGECNICKGTGQIDSIIKACYSCRPPGSGVCHVCLGEKKVRKGTIIAVVNDTYKPRGEE